MQPWLAFYQSNFFAFKEANLHIINIAPATYRIRIIWNNSQIEPHVLKSLKQPQWKTPIQVINWEKLGQIAVEFELNPTQKSILKYFQITRIRLPFIEIIVLECPIKFRLLFKPQKLPSL